MATKLCCVSVDLDEIRHYFAIHGLKSDGVAPTAAYDIALPRLGAFADALRLPLSLFAVGADLLREQNAKAAQAMARRGHAIENHSLSHRYDLTSLPPLELAAEVEGGMAIVARITGTRPTGFRAPGYTVTDALFDVLDELDVAFDSSVFPCPPYYFAKATAIGGMRLLGRRSRSVLDTPRVMAAPIEPYRPGKPWYTKGRRRFVEVPIQVTPRLRLPFIGTSIVLGGTGGARLLAKQCARMPIVNIETHAIDFIDRSEGLEPLRAHQPELRIPVGARMNALEAAIDVLRAEGFAFVRLDEAVRRFALGT